MSVRDRDIAASVMGISVPRAKTISVLYKLFFIVVLLVVFTHFYTLVTFDLMIYEVDRSFTILFHADNWWVRINFWILVGSNICL